MINSDRIDPGSISCLYRKAVPCVDERHQNLGFRSFASAAIPPCRREAESLAVKRTVIARCENVRLKEVGPLLNFHRILCDREPVSLLWEPPCFMRCSDVLSMPRETEPDPCSTRHPTGAMHCRVAKGCIAIRPRVHL